MPALVRWMIECGGAGTGLDQRKAAVDAEDADSGVESIGVEAVSRDDGNRDVVDESHAGSRVDDVRVAAAADVHVLLAAARSGNGRVGQLQHCGHAGQRLA